MTIFVLIIFIVFITIIAMLFAESIASAYIEARNKQ